MWYFSLFLYRTFHTMEYSVGKKNFILLIYVRLIILKDIDKDIKIGFFKLF